jgi:peptide/nickel transport system ATP-binding protein
MPEPLLATDHLTRHFKIGGALSRRVLHAVDDVSITIGERQIVALAGESGSGKSTVARLLARVYRPTSGSVTFDGQPVAGAGEGAGAGIRSRRAALRYSGQVPMVFQDPFSSIHPVFRVSHGVMRALKLHRPELSAAERRSEAKRVFGVVGLPADKLDSYPHELSGGQRQRVGFAQALATRPRLILADEPVSMLDVSVRIGLLNLMAKLRDEEGVSILYITHDIASARYVADRLIVMYAGQIAESGPIEDVLAAPRHPYTQLLLSAVPDPKAPLEQLPDRGEPPRVIDPKPGCRFRPRCPVAIDRCATVTPALLPVEGRDVACHVAVHPRGDDPPVDPPAKGGDPLEPPSRGNRHNPPAPGPPAYRAGDDQPPGPAAYRAGVDPPLPPGPPAYRAGDDQPPGLPASQAGRDQS